ncbi:MAG: hypothetical protein ACREBD_08490, partial [Blastocatellia bacterium]
ARVSAAIPSEKYPSSFVTKIFGISTTLLMRSAAPAPIGARGGGDESKQHLHPSARLKAIGVQSRKMAGRKMARKARRSLFSCPAFFCLCALVFNVF